MKSKTQQNGSRAEDSALEYLKAKGLKPVARNYTATRIGEIDLVMREGSTLVFVEVRLRRNPNFGSGAETITTAKQNRIIRTALHYLQAEKPLPFTECRFDVVSIGESIDWLPGAFTLD